MNGDEGKSRDELLGIVAGGAAWSFGGRIAKVGLLFLVEVVMARLLGMSSYGGITLAAVAISLGTTFGGLGLQRGIIRKLPYYEKDERKVRGVLWNGLGGGLAGSIALGIALFFSAPILASSVFNDPGVAVLFRVAAVAIPFSILVRFGVGTARAFNDPTTHVLIRQLFIPVSKTVAIPALIIAGFGVVGAAGGLAGSLILGGILAIILGFRHFPYDLRGPRKPMMGEMLAFSLPLMLASGAQFLITNTDIVLVGVFLATSQVGIYNAALKLMNLGWVFFYPVTLLVGPVLTRLDRDGHLNEAMRTYQVSVKWMSLATFPLFLLVFLFPEVVIGVTFGPEAVGGALALQLLILPVMFSILLGPNNGALVSFGHSRLPMYVNGVTVIANLALNLVLIPLLGIIGAAIATASSLGLKNVVYTGTLYRWYGIHPFSYALVRPIGMTIPLVVLGYVGFQKLLPTTFVTVTGVGILFMFVYAVIVIRMGGIEQEDIDVVSRFEKDADIQLDFLRSIVKRVQ